MKISRFKKLFFTWKQLGFLDTYHRGKVEHRVTHWREDCNQLTEQYETEDQS